MIRHYQKLASLVLLPWAVLIVIAGAGYAIVAGVTGSELIQKWNEDHPENQITISLGEDNTEVYTFGNPNDPYVDLSE